MMIIVIGAIFSYFQESGANDKEITTKIKEVLKSLFNIDYDLVGGCACKQFSRLRFP